MMHGQLLQYTVFCKLLVIVHSKWALSIVLLWLLDLIRNVLTHNFPLCPLISTCSFSALL